ncbi:hypothetical protein NN3_18450 [Nocardia neocaledoniensis NBRC 108232]|nr:hypothetical protein [Nocardia neocaledoniensis]GEM30838.1 hypothetical protein NN3_18450 [Nocardia neocaledoniensis NBRC 108232]
MLRATWHLPPGSVFGHEGPLLDAAAGHRPKLRLSRRQFDATRWVSLLSVAAWTLGYEHWLVRASANVSSCMVHCQNARLHERSWNYASHLHVFLLSLSAVRTPTTETQSALVAGLQSYFASIYAQAGLSKLIAAGPHWADGATLRGSWAEYGTPLGRRLSTSDLRIAAAASGATLLIELGLLPLLFLAGRRGWKIVGLSSLAFHAASKATMDISFWHLAWFAYPLFLADTTAVCPRLVAGLPPHNKHPVT